MTTLKLTTLANDVLLAVIDGDNDGMAMAMNQRVMQVTGKISRAADAVILVNEVAAMLAANRLITDDFNDGEWAATKAGLRLAAAYADTI